MLAGWDWHHRDFDLPAVHCVLCPPSASAEERLSILLGIRDLKSGDVQPISRKDRVCKPSPDEKLPEECPREAPH